MPTPYITLEEKNLKEKQTQIHELINVSWDREEMTTYQYYHLQCMLLLSERLNLLMDAIKRGGEM